MSITPPRHDSSHDTPIDWEAFDRYLSGECTVTEAEQMEARFAQYPEARAAMSRLIASTGVTASAPTTRAAWGRMRTRLGVPAVGTPRHTSEHGSRSQDIRTVARGTRALSWGRRYIAIAAVGVATVIGIVGISAHRVSSRRAEMSTHTYITAAGQRATVTLPDGTRAVLAPSSTLIVSVPSSQATVDAHVVGQVLFTVAHQQGRLFRVQAGNATANVLGTTFLIRHYTAEKISQVVVADGRVAVTSATPTSTRLDNAVLSAGAMATVNDAGRIQVTEQVPLGPYTAWTRGELVFHDTPVRDAMLELGRAYGVEIRIADSSLAARPLNATILVTRQSLSAVLESLTDVLEAHVVRAGQIITLTPGRSATRRSRSPIPSFTPESRYGR